MLGVDFLFYLFSSIAVVSGVMVITSANPVHSVLFLILVFCNAAGLLILLELDFFAMIFLVVYVGAIAVLFLFVVMMLNIRLTEVSENILRYLPIGGVIAFLFLFEILLVVDNDLVSLLAPESISAGLSFQESLLYQIQTWVAGLGSNSDIQLDLNNLKMQSPFSQLIQWTPPTTYVEWTTQIQPVTSIQAIGQILYTYYFYYFILSSFILLIAMIGAIMLTMQAGTPVKRQLVFEQNTRDFTRTVQKIRG